MFSECEIPEEVIEQALNAAGQGQYVYPRSRSRRIRVWTRLAANSIVDRYNGGVTSRITIREVTVPGNDPFLLVGVHLWDRQRLTTEEGRGLSVGEVAARVRQIERTCGHSRTLLIGDLNMNPYEAGVVGTQALHAVMTRELTATVASLTPRERHSCFYNPMWCCFGDVSSGPPGTYYWVNVEEPTNHFWQIYDQALIRPDLLDKFVRVEILAHDGQESLLTPTGRPRAGSLSDHLPLYCEFNFS
ncbi:MAG: hypothetical protein L0241_16515 [Planctomycetia bacterium]|nr:hypothetical protein [Planctomycetia bacterium]